MTLEVIRSVDRTCRGRSRRRCFACGLPLLEGDRYVDTTYRDDTVYSLVEHAECAAAVVYLEADWFVDGLPARYLVEYLEPEHVTDAWRRWYAARLCSGEAAQGCST